jgi:hypothetical protein
LPRLRIEPFGGAFLAVRGVLRMVLAVMVIVIDQLRRT